MHLITHTDQEFCCIQQTLQFSLTKSCWAIFHSSGGATSDIGAIQRTISIIPSQ